ncbi:MAG: hypothetical protein JKX85_03110 [Phycisphaeraceae bacterium]|nr:hypothetical protein [Phycisphaeraceae bacterium]
MKNHGFLTLALGLLVNLFGCVMTDTVVHAQSSEPVTLSAPKSSRPIPPYFFGVHTNLMPYSIGKVRQWTEMAARDTQLVTEIKFTSLRGPSGGPGNCYLWKEGEVLNPADPRYAKYYGYNRYGYRRKHTLEEGYPALMMEDIYITSKATSLPYVFQLNVISQDMPTLVQQVQRITEITDQPIFLEYGSELYNGAYMGAKATADPYHHAQEMGELTQKIKAIDPNIQVAIDGPSPALQRRALIFKNRGQGDQPDWDGSPAGRILNFSKAVTQNIQNFDATVIHTYTPIATMEGQTPTSMMRYFFAFNELEQQACKEYFTKLKGKQVWVTEWGILHQTMFHEKDMALKAKKQILKTPGVAVATIDWLMRMLDLKQITITTHHNLIDPQGFGLVQKGPKKTLIRLPLYYVFKAVGQLFADHPDYFPLQTDTQHSQSELVLQELDMKTFGTFGLTPPTVSLPDVGIWGFGKAKNLKAVVLINRTDEPRKVTLPGHTLARYWTYGGSDPLPGFMEAKKHWTMIPEVNPLPTLLQEKSAKTITLDPFSMTLATVK